MKAIEGVLGEKGLQVEDGVKMVEQCRAVNDRYEQQLLKIAGVLSCAYLEKAVDMIEKPSKGLTTVDLCTSIE